MVLVSHSHLATRIGSADTRLCSGSCLALFVASPAVVLPEAVAADADSVAFVRPVASATFAAEIASAGFAAAIAFDGFAAAFASVDFASAGFGHLAYFPAARTDVAFPVCMLWWHAVCASPWKFRLLPPWPRLAGWPLTRGYAIQHSLLN